MFDIPVQIGRVINPHQQYHSGRASDGTSLATIGDIRCDVSVYANHQVQANGVVLTSDDRIKHNEVSISNGLEIIRQLNTQKYIKTINIDDTDISNGSIEVGFIAQDILAINDLSFSVSGGDKIDESGNIIASKYILNYNNIFSYNVAATKELDAIVQAQATEIAELKSALNELLVLAGKSTI